MRMTKIVNRASKNVKPFMVWPNLEALNSSDAPSDRTFMSMSVYPVKINSISAATAEVIIKGAAIVSPVLRRPTK